MYDVHTIRAIKGLYKGGEVMSTKNKVMISKDEYARLKAIDAHYKIVIKNLNDLGHRVPNNSLAYAEIRRITNMMIEKW